MFQRQNRIVRTLALFVCGSLISATVSADVIELKDGRRFSGRLVSRREAEKQLVVELDSGVMMLVNQKDIKLHMTQSEAEREYATRAAAMPDTIEGHMEMVAWCAGKGLPNLANTHYERILELDPDHKLARAALRYQFERGQWVRRDVVMSEQRGKIKIGNAWVFPEVAAMEQSRAKAKEELDTLNKDLRRWNDDVAKERRNSADSMAKIQALEGPTAAAAIRSLFFPNGFQKLSTNLPPVPLRLEYVKILARSKSGESLQTLIQISMNDPDDSIRSAARLVLKELGPREATIAYLAALERSGQPPSMIEAIGTGLADMNDPIALLPAMRHLVTTYQKDFIVGGSTNVGFSNDNLGGQGNTISGQQNKRVIENHQSPSLLRTLTGLTGQDFGYDREAWERWYATTNFRTGSDLRRDP
ncbi:MAG: hypothetical protein U0892_23095 [Pirellulales bacterium]